jgi:hypothetical protein
MENLSISGGFYFDKSKLGYEEYNFIVDSSEIFQALAISKNEERMIALIVPSISEGLFITAVDDIVEQADGKIIIVKQYNSNGIMIKRNKICLHEIMGACLLTSKWVNPILKVMIKDNVPWLKVDDSENGL